MKKTILLLAGFIFTSGFLTAQTSYYHTDLFQQAASLNKAIVAGSNFFFGFSENSLFAVMKTDSTGHDTWAKTFGTGSANDIIVDDDNHVIAAGEINGRFAVLNLQQGGIVQWQYNFYDTLNRSNAASLIQLTDSSYLIEGSDGGRVVFVRLSQQGNLMFISSPKIALAAGKLAATPDGGFASLNVNTDTLTDSLNFTISRFDSSANLLWAQQYTWHDSVNITSFASIAGGGFILAGIANDTASGNETKSVLLTRLDSAGNVLWANYYTNSISTSNAVLNSVMQTTDGSFVSCGTVNTGLNGYNILSFKADSAGTFLMAKNYETIHYNNGTDAGIYNSGYVFFGSESAGGVTNNLVIIRTDSSAQSGCVTDSIGFSAKPVVLNTDTFSYTDTTLSYSGITQFSAATLSATLNSACPQTPYSHYYPMLDSVNIWHYIPNGITESPSPGNNNNSKSLNSCGYPFNPYDNNEEYTEGDTIISGVLYKQIWRNTTAYPAQACLLGFIREDTSLRKVFFKDVLNSPEITIYDFSMHAGDSIYIQYYDTTISGWFLLDSVTNIQIFVGQRRAFYLHRPHTTNYNQSFNGYALWIESTGSLLESVYPYMFNYGGYPLPNCSNNYSYNYYNQYAQFVSCFGHNQIVYFDSCSYAEAVEDPQCWDTKDSCYYYNICGSIKEVSDLSSFNIYPNPSSGEITLSLDVNQSSAFDILVLDMQGREVLPATHLGQLNNGLQTRQIDVSALASGIYFVACRNGNGEIYRKLVIQH